MIVRAKNARCIGKDMHRFDNGDTVFRAIFVNDKGDQLRVQLSDNVLHVYDTLELFDKRYDLVLEARTSGWKNYVDLLEISESK